MTVDESGFCDLQCDDCGAEIDLGEWHTHTDDGESLCLDCADSDVGKDGLGMNQSDGEKFARRG